MLLAGILLLALTPVNSLLGFDCGGRHLNITSVSLLNSGDCDLEIKTTNDTNVYIQLLQLSEYNYAEVIQCKIEIQRHIYYCGMHSHVSIVRGGYSTYLDNIGRNHCIQMHETGTANVGFNRLTKLLVNTTNIRNLIMAGTVNADGKCTGGKYNDPYGDWDNVVVMAIAKITLKSSYVPVHLNSGKIHLKSGTTCELKEGRCVDPDDGFTYWNTVPVTTCDFHAYDVLYEGFAKRIRDDTTQSNSPVVYSLVSQDITFALMTTKEVPLCGYTLLRTEHPKLFIVETTKGNEPKPRSDISVDNLDIFSYVNSKFVYVEKHMRTQMTNLYQNVIEQRCKLERKVIENILSLATLLPDEFAYRLMKGPGYMAVNAGEAMHVVQCIPVEVTVRRTKECYLELPITLRNASLYLTPKSRIITRVGTQRECSYELPTLYRIEDTWIQLTPDPHVRQVAPQQLQPLTKISWKYLTPGSLATSGIYNQDDINKLRDHIMFPAEKPALLNSVARGITGYSHGDGTISMYNLLDEDTLNKIAQSTASKLWGGFVTFGSATAGVLGIFIIIRVIKIIIDTAIHGYALHTVYGCSLHLLGAIWSSLAHLLLHLAHRPKPPNQENNANSNPQEDEERPVSTQPTTSKDGQITATAPPNSPLSITASQTVSYRELNKRISDLEQIPPKTSEFVFKRGEV